MLNSSVLDLYNLIDSHIFAEGRIPIILFFYLKLDRLCHRQSNKESKCHCAIKPGANASATFITLLISYTNKP